MRFGSTDWGSGHRFESSISFSKNPVQSFWRKSNISSPCQHSILQFYTGRIYLYVYIYCMYSVSMYSTYILYIYYIPSWWSRNESCNCHSGWILSLLPASLAFFMLLLLKHYMIIYCIQGWALAPFSALPLHLPHPQLAHSSVLTHWASVSPSGWRHEFRKNMAYVICILCR